VRRRSNSWFLQNHVVILGALGNRRCGPVMSIYQAFFLGMMVAWTPSLLVLAWALCEVPDANDGALKK